LGFYVLSELIQCLVPFFAQVFYVPSSSRVMFYPFLLFFFFSIYAKIAGSAEGADVSYP
jgi:hypothetical protein